MAKSPVRRNNARQGEKVLRAVRPNIGITVAYRERIEALIEEMQRSYAYRLMAAYRRNKPSTTEILAQDAAGDREIDRILRDLERALRPTEFGRGMVGRIVLPNGIEIIRAENPRQSNSRGARRGGGLTTEYRILYPGQRYSERVTRANLRLTLSDALAYASPTESLDAVLENLGARWQQRFEESAPKMAEYFATAVEDRSDRVLKKILRDGGYSVRFQPTQAMRDVAQASVSENVGLIRSIPQQYHTQVQTLVMESVQRGRDLEYLAKGLKARYPITKKRAALIARDQNNKMTSAMQAVRQTELGIEKGVWLHSHAGKKPRRTHLANNGKQFVIAEGWFDPDPRVQRNILPGELINCRCTWKPVVPGFS